MDAEAVPPSIDVARAHEQADLQWIAALETEVWADDWSRQAEDLADRFAAQPDDGAI